MKPKIAGAAGSEKMDPLADAEAGRPAQTNAIDGFSVAVIIPCYNEEAAIGRVVRDFRQRLPSARIYIYDNGSSDRTAEIASAAGATVRSEPMRGKGNVVRRMFSDVDADIYVMTDGDETYDASSSRLMIEALISGNLDMVVGTRLDSTSNGLFPAGHRWGNAALTWFVGVLFGKRFRDVLSGYRVLSKRFVKSFPGLSTGFEIETELTIHALELRMPVGEIETPYFERPDGSSSKLATLPDGLKILWTIINLLRELRPLFFFGSVASVLAVLAIVLTYPLLGTYLETGLVPRFPTAILATGVMILSFVSFTCGIILDNVSSGRWEAKRMRYLSIPSVLNSPS